MIIFFVCAEPDYAPLTSHLPSFFFTLIQPLSLTPLSHPHPPSLSRSLSVSDRVCYMSRLPACSVPTSPSSGDVVSSPLSPGNRRVRSPPRGAGVGREGEETSRFFFPSPSIPKSESSKYPCAYTCTHAQYEGLGPQSKEWCQFTNYVLINIPHQLPKGSVSGSVQEPLLFLLLKAFFPSLATIGIWVATAVTCKIYLQKKTLGFQVRLFSFVLSHSSARNRHSISEDDRNASSRWMTLVCSRPSSVCVLSSEIKLQCINQHAGQR